MRPSDNFNVPLARPLRLALLSLVAAAVLAATLEPISAHAAAPELLHYFSANHAGLYTNGATPLYEVTEAPDGSFFTSTQNGGPVNTCVQEFYLLGCGTMVQIAGGAAKAVFRFQPPAAASANGALPASGLVQGPDGALYGTTPLGPRRSPGRSVLAPFSS